MNEHLKPSNQIVEFLKEYEQFKPYPYFATPFEQAQNIKTIGYGHVIKAGEKFTTLTKEQAHDLLIQDINEHLWGIRRYIKVPLTQYQFDALVSFHFNAGAAALTIYTGLRDLINSKRFKEAADKFLQYNTQNKVVLKGLTLRRKSERQIFLGGPYVRLNA